MSNVRGEGERTIDPIKESTYTGDSALHDIYQVDL